MPKVGLIGAGVNYQTAEAELTNAVFVGSEGRTKLEADDAAWGWNVGAIFQVTPIAPDHRKRRSDAPIPLVSRSPQTAPISDSQILR